MAVKLKPRRGKKADAISQNIILEKGEIFLEYPDEGCGTGNSRLKIGDGITVYGDLPYAIGGSVVTTLTQAEYDALPDTKYSDDIVYFITDSSLDVRNIFMTQEQYDALPDTKYSDGIFYYITDSVFATIEANQIPYNNEEFGMVAENVQEAIDEIVSKFPIKDKQILEAGNTLAIFENENLTDDHFTFVTSKPYVAPTSVEYDSAKHRINIVYPAQESNITVAIRCEIF